MPAFAERMSRVQVAASVQMTIRARELRAQGVDIIQLTIGQPDFDSPPHAIEAAHAAALRGETKYPPQDGTPALKQAIWFIIFVVVLVVRPSGLMGQAGAEEVGLREQN